MSENGYLKRGGKIADALFSDKDSKGRSSAVRRVQNKVAEIKKLIGSKSPAEIRRMLQELEGDLAGLDGIQGLEALLNSVKDLSIQNEQAASLERERSEEMLNDRELVKLYQFHEERIEEIDDLIDRSAKAFDEFFDTLSDRTQKEIENARDYRDLSEEAQRELTSEESIDASIQVMESIKERREYDKKLAKEKKILEQQRDDPDAKPEVVARSEVKLDYVNKQIKHKHEKEKESGVAEKEKRALKIASFMISVQKHKHIKKTPQMNKLSALFEDVYHDKGFKDIARSENKELESVISTLRRAESFKGENGGLPNAKKKESRGMGL
ncbi:MAG: hypothetical protein RLN62_06800 [Rickettsiales bacterium]